MAGMAPEGSQFDASFINFQILTMIRHSYLCVHILFSLNLFYFDYCMINAEADDFFTPYEEVCDTFDAMGLHENLLRGIYAYGEVL